MKNWLLLVVLGIIGMGQTCSQKNFEGSITYKMDLEGDFVSLMAAYMPESYTFSFKDGNTLIRIKSGFLETFMGKILYLGESNEAYILKEEEKTAFRLGNGTDPGQVDENQNPPKMVETNESETILGYTCKMYKMIFNEGGNELIQYVWATKEIDLKMNGLTESGVPGTFNFYGLDAFPLKMKSTFQESGIEFTMVLTANTIKKEKLNQKDFHLPADYEIKNMDNLMNMMK